MSAGECVQCGNMTMVNEAGHCKACAPVRRPRQATASPPVSYKKAPRVPLRERFATDKRWQLGGLVLALVVVQGGLMAWDRYDQPVVAPELRYRQELGRVTGAVQAIKAETGRLPSDGAAIQAYMKKNGVTPPAVVGPHDDAGPGTVVYEVKGQAFNLKVVNDDGAFYYEKGQKTAARD